MQDNKLHPWTRYANAYEAAEKASEEAREIVKCLGIPYSDAMDQIREAKFTYRKALVAELKAAHEADEELRKFDAEKVEKHLAEYREKNLREKEESGELEEFRLWKAQQPPKKI